MVFNEILIPQDFFTEINVTRKRVCRRKFLIIFQNTIIILFENWFKMVLKFDILKLIILKVFTHRGKYVKLFIDPSH